MSFTVTWLLGFVGVVGFGVLGVAGVVPGAVAGLGSGAVLVALVGYFQWRMWRVRNRDRADRKSLRAWTKRYSKKVDGQLRALGAQSGIEAVVAEQERQARALRSLQEAQLAAKRSAPAAQVGAMTMGAPARERVLLWRGPAQYDLNLQLDLVLAAELEAQNAVASLVLCDGAAGCLQRRDDARKADDLRGLTDDWEARCGRCFSDRGLDHVREAGIPYFTFNGAVDPKRRAEFRALAEAKSEAEIVDYVHRGMKVGHWAASSTIRYFFGVDPMKHPRFLPMLREYFYTSLLSAEAAWSIFREFQPTRIIMQHGIYVEWGPAFELAAQRGIPLTRWTRGYSYRGHHWFVKTVDDTDRRHPHHAPEHRWRRVSRRSLTRTERVRLQHYMDAQSLKENNRYVLYERERQTPEQVREQLGLPEDKPVFAVFCHLSWDAQYGFEERTNGNTFREWLEDSVETAIATDDVHWLIKVHPAERVNKQSIGCAEHIAKRFGDLPDHVQVLPAELSINTYDLYPLLDGVVTIFGTAGLEAAILGKKVILAGHAHYGSKGFTFDSPTRRDYVTNLANAATLPRPTSVQVEIARRYGYEYFVSRQLPFDPAAAYEERKRGQMDPRRARMLHKWVETALDGGAFAMDNDEVAFYEEFPEVPDSGLDWAGLDLASEDDEAAEASTRPLSGVYG